MDIRDYIKSNEGLRLKPYRCSANKLTIGYGRNLEDIGISEKEAEFLLADDIGECFSALFYIFRHIFNQLTNNRQMALVDMMFNLGNTRFLGFKKMIRAVRDNDFEEAGLQILDSNYARQLPGRSKNNAELMRKG